jgi:hypothetical protein
MYARYLALFCLLPLSIASGASLPDAREDVVVYLKPAAGLSAFVLEEAKTELASVMRGAGAHIVWWESEWSRSSVAGTLIVADFTGTCSVPLVAVPVADVSRLPPLAHTTTADGRILPFAFVDCRTLSEFMGPALMDLPIVRREQLYGRAIGRVLAHEIYHILAQTPLHAAAGVAKMHFSTADLLAPRFEFEPTTSAHLFGVPAHSRAGRTLIGF